MWILKLVKEPPKVLADGSQLYFADIYNEETSELIEVNSTFSRESTYDEAVFYFKEYVSGLNDPATPEVEPEANQDEIFELALKVVAINKDLTIAINELVQRLK